MVTDLDGNFMVQIGSTGEEGLRDGTFDNAAFNRPQVRIKISQSLVCCSFGNSIISHSASSEYAHAC